MGISYWTCWGARTPRLGFSRLSWAVSSLQIALTHLRVLSVSKGEGRASAVRGEDISPQPPSHSLGNPLSSTGTSAWRKRGYRKEAASLESLPMHGDSSSSPCRLPKAEAALEKQPWLQSVAGKSHYMVLGPGPGLCICRSLARWISPGICFSGTEWAETCHPEASIPILQKVFLLGLSSWLQGGHASPSSSLHTSGSFLPSS